MKTNQVMSFTRRWEETKCLQTKDFLAKVMIKQSRHLVKEVVFVELLRSLNLTPYERQKRTIYPIDQVCLPETQGLYFQNAGLLKSLLIGHLSGSKSEISEH